MALIRDAYTLEGRPDVKQHLRNLGSDRKVRGYVPTPEVEYKIALAAKSLPNLKQQTSDHLIGGTYVSLEDAILLQESIYKGKSQVVNVTSSEGGIREELFSVPWPPQLLCIHRHQRGECFPRIEDVGKLFFSWSTMAAIVCITEIWALTASLVSSNQDVHGKLRGRWLLERSCCQRQKHLLLWRTWASKIFEIAYC